MVAWQLVPQQVAINMSLNLENAWCSQGEKRGTSPSCRGWSTVIFLKCSVRIKKLSTRLSIQFLEFPKQQPSSRLWYNSSLNLIFVLTFHYHHQIKITELMLNDFNCLIQFCILFLVYVNYITSLGQEFLVTSFSSWWINSLELYL